MIAVMFGYTPCLSENGVNPAPNHSTTRPIVKRQFHQDFQQILPLDRIGFEGKPAADSEIHFGFEH